MFNLKRVFDKMREGLRSHTRRVAEKEMIDLNKDPVEDDGLSSKSPHSSAYFSAEEKVDCGLDVDISSNAVDGKGTKGGEITGGSEGTLGCASTNDGSLPEDPNGSRSLEDKRGANTVDVQGLNVSSGVKTIGEPSGRRRGRKRKMASHAQSLNGGSANQEEMVAVARDEEDGFKPDVVQDGHDAGVGGNVVDPATVNTGKGCQESSKPRRGRKRKALVNSEGNKYGMDAGGEAKRLALDGTSQTVGRVLRSRTREAIAAEKQASLEKKGPSDREGEMGFERSGNENVKMEAETDESTRPVVNLKRRGRPPKMHGKNGSSKVTVNFSAKLRFQKKNSLTGADVAKVHRLKLRKRKVNSASLNSHKENNIDEREGELRPKEEKQLLKEQIIGILKEAGWTIEYRPRNGKDYLDSVYVDGEGRTHWSVTLAYEKLKTKIADGKANKKEVDAFTPIPDDKLSKLFRITKEGKKSVKGLSTGQNGNKNSKERLKRKSAGHHQGETSLNEKNEGVSCEQENSVVVSRMRKRNSSRGGSRKPYGLVVRESKDELYKGKRTLLSWMIDLGTISPGDKVQYPSHEMIDVVHGGKITREGICCECCGKIFTLVDFERHTGSSLGQPLQNISLESGKSLLQCMSTSWSKQEEIDHIGFNFVNIENDPDDDTCNICADGGDLICCDGCPSTFHLSCLQIQSFPTGDWHCIYCSCKFCGMVCSGNSEGISVLDSDDSGYLTCLFCEEKFHVNCMLKKEDKTINMELIQFCGRGCEKLFENLQKLLGMKHELGEGYFWTILRRQDLSCTTDPLKIESNSKLAIAFSIIDECFTPITDERSNIDLIRSVCYSCGSNIRRLNYSGFCTVILEKNDELVAAATIRVHGNQLAEMPFIGTREIHRRKGMCRLLLNAIEMVLSSLDVEMLVIPSVSELSETWTKVFGFVPLDESRRQEMKHMSLVLFPGADLLQKPLQKYHVTDGETSAAGASLSQPSNELMNGHMGPMDDTSVAIVGSDLHQTCDSLNHGPGSVNGLVNSITSSKDELCHDFDTSKVKLETFNSGTPEGNQVDKSSCLHEGKECLKSQHKTAVCSQ